MQPAMKFEKTAAVPVVGIKSTKIKLTSTGTTGAARGLSVKPFGAGATSSLGARRLHSV